ncbi:unnamed protein product [Adineta steineri]|uniref:Uncharacterized protein n=1 Tax=Adineta steineri TaxID=433720 RepID=A0A818RRW4_9BILA|nr:unnamed protein product [Adineta steineri]CAF3661944.1 unnamed protein product [Adineta steineri]
MPSKKRWTLIPRKWFGTIANAAQKRDREQKIQLDQMNVSSTVPHRLSLRSKTKIEPIYSSTTTNDKINPQNTSTSVTPFQLPAFNIRRGTTLTVLPSSTLFNRTNTVVPSIRKKVQVTEPLSISSTTRTNTQILPSLSLQQTYFHKQQTDMSDECLIDYPRTIKRSLSLTRTHSSSSSMDNNESISSGIYSDERTDSNNHHRIPSKETLLTLETFSTESLADSHISLDHGESHLPIHHRRLSLSTLETTHNNNNKSVHFHNVQETQINRPNITKNRQSSAAIIKKIEKRIPINRSPPTPLEKKSFVRIANDTYRLTTKKDDHLYRRQRPTSIIPYSIYDDSLPPANNEDCYAQLPRTSSTEQINNNLKNDLRAIVSSIDKTMYNNNNNQSTKTHYYTKHSHINLDNITDKLLSSMNSSIYSQYQRCYY